jgi:hypothetical protein
MRKKIQLLNTKTKYPNAKHKENCPEHLESTIRGKKNQE